jgi:hypothetical protein
MVETRSTAATALRLAIRECDDIKREIMPVPEWKQTMEIRGLTTGERGDVFDRARTDATGEHTDPRLLFPLVMIAACYVPETNEKLFEDGDIDWLVQKSAGVTARIASAILRLSGLRPEEVEAIKKGSGATPTTDSSSN